VAGHQAATPVTVWDANGAEVGRFSGQVKGALIYTLAYNQGSLTRFDSVVPLVESAGAGPAGQPRNRVLWNRNGTRLAAVFADPRGDHAHVWDQTGGETLLLLQAEGYDLGSLRWSPDGPRLAGLWYH